jgi:Rad3-related DNA helicase
VAFKGRGAVTPPPSTPEALFRDLPRKPNAVPSLWVHQADVLRAYVAEGLADVADLALELPTGTGKTVPALLTADWTRRVRSARVAYACPTQQLARQVLATAEREGIPAALLVGGHRGWPVAAQAAYEAAEAVGVITYSTVFNSSPKLAEADLLVFDDAHAGEQYVAEQYSVLIRRSHDGPAYAGLLDALAPAIDGMFVQRFVRSPRTPRCTARFALSSRCVGPGWSRRWTRCCRV